jgi:hypothetical protein
MSNETLTPQGAKNIGASDKAQGKEPVNTSNTSPALANAYQDGYKGK